MKKRLSHEERINAAKKIYEQIKTINNITPEMKEVYEFLQNSNPDN